MESERVSRVSGGAPGRTGRQQRRVLPRALREAGQQRIEAVADEPGDGGAPAGVRRHPIGGAARDAHHYDAIAGPLGQRVEQA